MSHLKKYRARIDIPVRRPAIHRVGVVAPHDFMAGMDIEIGALPYSPYNHDVLLGMNFLSGFHITMFGNRFILSN